MPRPALLLVLVVAWLPGLAAAYQGFGAAATGGTGMPLYHVTNCRADNPPAVPTPGSLRDAVSRGNRYIVFEVACDPPVDFDSSYLYVPSNTTIDGFTAPPPGYKYKGTILIGGQKCEPRCHNVVVRGLICMGGKADCFGAERGAHTIVFDHNSATACGDECFGFSAGEGRPPIYQDTRHITVSRNLIVSPLRPGGAQTSILITSRTRGVSIHYNLIYDAKRRNPMDRYDDAGTVAGDTTSDIRNNLLYRVGGETRQDAGVIVASGARVNIINNYFRPSAGLGAEAKKRMVVVCAGAARSEEVGACSLWPPVSAAYVRGNLHDDSAMTAYINSKSTTQGELPAAFVETLDACAAAQSIRQDVGAPYKDAVFREALRSIELRGCQEPSQAPR